MKWNFGKLMVIAFAAMILVSAASAQTLVANVPFGFQVNDNQLQAGKYLVEVGAGKVVALRPEGGGATIFITNSAGPNDGKRAANCLVFRQYNGTMHLSQIWTSGADEGRTLPLKTSETRIAKKGHEAVVLAEVR
jgi:hypothetical protein